VGLAITVALHALYRTRSFGRGGALVEARRATDFVILVIVALISFGTTEPMLTIPLGWWALVIALTMGVSPRGGATIDHDYSEGRQPVPPGRRKRGPGKHAHRRKRESSNRPAFYE
jgi:hypothetical protein